ncbi:MAG: sigma-70 family RNA polymerase sigma factor [Chitinophagaceae bacterium]|nr:sigma-70 family RNA polymerase sigma factor [Chitinophagaceae bacterium]
MDNSHQKKEHKYWQSFLAGDRESFSWLYETYVDEIYSYGLRFVSDTGLIEDTIQDLYIRIWNNRNGLKIPPSVRNYLFTAFRNLLFRKLSRLSHVSTNEVKDDNHLFNWELPIEDEKVRDEEQNSRFKQLQKLIDVLTPHQREVLFLKYYYDLSYDEIADVMGLTVKAIYKVAGRAMKSMRTQWMNLVSLIIISQSFIW